MNHRNLTTIVFLLLTTLSVVAQTPISGQVRDASTREAMDFVNVALMTPGHDLPVDGAATDEEGQFMLIAPKFGDYQIVVSMVGYAEQTRPVKVTSKEPIDLGKIYLREDAQALEEVEVVAQGSQMRFELDKKVFTVDQAIAAAGGTVTDALEQIPSVDVDQEGNISLRNSDAVEIWINGKPAGLTSENRGTILQQMPAGSIKEIEVITNPSAKYSPEGTAGIINLVMKKDPIGGYYGSLDARLNYMLASPWTVPPGFHLGGNINFSKGVVDGYLNVGYHYQVSNGSSVNDRYSFGSDTTRLKKDGKTYNKGGGMFVRAGLDFHVTDRSIIGISGFGMINVKGDKTKGFFSDIEDRPTHYEEYLVEDFVGPRSAENIETLTRSYDRNQNGSGNHPGGNVMLDWRFTISKKHYLSTSAQFSEFNWNQDMFYDQIENELKVTQEQLNENLNRSIQLKADYEWKPTQQSRFEAGWQTDIAWRNTLADAWEGADRETRLTSYYNDFRNFEQTHALYVTYGNRFWDRFSVQVGLRGEFFKRHIESQYFLTEGTPASFQQDTSYFQLFPSVYLNYTFDNGHELQANYTRRINRPRGNQINPRQNFSDSTNIQYGNPGLLPAYSSAVELNYLKHWERHTISAGLFYRYQDNVIQNIKFMDQDVMRNTFINLGKRHEAGVELVVKNKFFKEILNLTTNFNFYYNRLDRATYTPVVNGRTCDEVIVPEQNIFAWSVKLNIGLMFTKTFTGQINANYRSPRVVAQGRSSHSYSIDLSLRKTFLDRTLALAVNVRDILNSRARENTTSSDSFWQYSTNRWNSRELSVSLTWNFGNMKRKYDRETQRRMSDSSADAANQWTDEGANE